MEPSRKQNHLILSIFLLASCTSMPQPEKETVTLSIERPATRSADPDEYRISDCQVWVFHPSGLAEEQHYISPREREDPAEPVRLSLRLVRNIPYRIYACANLGYRLPLRSEEELRSFRFHLAYPDEYSRGMPMAAYLEEALLKEETDVISLPLERLMGRIDLVIDRDGLDPDVQLTFREARIGACPRSVQPFDRSRAESAEGLFSSGFVKEGSDCDILNREIRGRESGTLSLYLLENDQSTGREALSSYLELKAEYLSPDWETSPGEYLIYRFYLTENHFLQRNTVYPLTVRLEGDALHAEGWNLDREGLRERIRFELHPAAFNTCTSQEHYHIWCDISPSRTPVEIEPLAYDEDERVAALYDYTLDPDGHGLTIHPHKGGTAMVYIKAGHPVDRDTLAMLVIDP